MIQLWEHQKRAIDLFKSFDYRIYLNWDTGTGKTIGSLAICDNYNMKNVLVVAPRSSSLSWKHDNEHFDLNLDVYTYETFRNKFTNDMLSKYDIIIFDECHRLKNPSAKVSKKAYEIIGKSTVPRIFLSGTPADKFFELYMQYKILDENIVSNFKSYSKFINTYYYLDKYWQPKRLKKSSYAKELKTIFSQKTHRVRKEDVIELPDITYITVDIEPFDIEKLSSEFENLKNVDITKFTRYYMYNQGIDENGRVFNNSKISWTIDFLEDNRDTIVFAYFRNTVDTLKKILGNKAYYITGEDKRDLESAVIEADKPVIATYAIKEGANLQKYRNIVFLTLPLSFRDYEQSISRVYRAGQKQKVTIYNLLQNDIDFIVYNILSQKKDVFSFLREKEV